MAASPFASLLTTTHHSLLSSSSSTRRPETRPSRSFLHLSSQPLNLSSEPLHLSSHPQLKAICNDRDTSLINPQCRSLKARLAAGDILYGIFLQSFCPTIAEIAGLAGYDYVVIDMEHGPGGISEALQCLRVLATTHTPVILRVPERSAAWTKKALDIGPQGILFPSIESVSAAEMAVSYSRFRPRGVRGAAHTVIKASAYGFNGAYVSQCEEELLIICQVETITGIEKIEAIAAVDGVDVIMTGPRDLSASMGYLHDPSHKKVKEILYKAERRILNLKMEGRPVYMAGFPMQNEPPEMLKHRGYHMVSGAMDLSVFKQAVVNDVKRFRSADRENPAYLCSPTNAIAFAN